MKTIRIVHSAIIFCILLLIVIYCYSLYKPDNTDTYDRHFVFVSPLRYWSGVAYGIKSADHDFHTNTKLFGSEKLNIENQIQTLRDVIQTKPDGIITAAPEESEEFKEVIHLAVSQGIPVVLIDSDFPGIERSCYIGTDNYSAGKLAGEDMYTASNGKAKICIVLANMENPNQKARYQGFIDEISQYENMEVIDTIECHSEPLEILEKISQTLKEYPEIDSLFLAEGMSSAKAARIIKNDTFSSRKFNIIAFDKMNDTCSLLKDGTYYSIITQDLYMQGYLAVQTLNQILDKEPTKQVIYTDTYSLKSDDIDIDEQYTGEALEWNLY